MVAMSRAIAVQDVAGGPGACAPLDPGAPDALAGDALAAGGRPAAALPVRRPARDPLLLRAQRGLPRRAPARARGARGARARVPPRRRGRRARRGRRRAALRPGGRPDAARPRGRSRRSIGAAHARDLRHPLRRVRAADGRRERARAAGTGSPSIEDCALSLLAAEGTRPLGSTGTLGVFCFYKTLPGPERRRAGGERPGRRGRRCRARRRAARLDALPRGRLAARERRASALGEAGEALRAGARGARTRSCAAPPASGPSRPAPHVRPRRASDLGMSGLSRAVARRLDPAAHRRRAPAQLLPPARPAARSRRRRSSPSCPPGVLPALLPARSARTRRRCGRGWRRAGSRRWTSGGRPPALRARGVPGGGRRSAGACSSSRCTRTSSRTTWPTSRARPGGPRVRRSGPGPAIAVGPRAASRARSRRSRASGGALRRRRRAVAVPLVGVALHLAAAFARAAPTLDARGARTRAAARGAAPARRRARASRARAAGSSSGTASPARTGSTCWRARRDAGRGARGHRRGARGRRGRLGRARPRGPPVRLADRGGAPARRSRRGACASTSSAASSARGSRCAAPSRPTSRRNPAPRDLRAAGALARAPARVPRRGRQRPEEAAAAMEDFLRLHRLRWAAEGGSYGIPPGAPEAFHREVAPLLAARGWLRLYRLLRRRRRHRGGVRDRGGPALLLLPVRLRSGLVRAQPGAGAGRAAPSRTPTRAGSPTTTSCAARSPTSSTGRLTGARPAPCGSGRRRCGPARPPRPRRPTARRAGVARAVAPERVWGALRRARRERQVNAGGGRARASARPEAEGGACRSGRTGARGGWSRRALKVAVAGALRRRRGPPAGRRAPPPRGGRRPGCSSSPTTA